MLAWDSNAGLRHKQIISGQDLSYSFVLTPAIIEAIGEVHSKEPLLDAGCGSGVLSRELHQLGWDVTGIDIAPDMIQVASEANGQNNGPKFLTVDMADMSNVLPAKSFSVIVANMSITGIADLTPVLKNLRHCLTDSGKLVITDVHPWFWREYKGRDIPYWSVETVDEPFSTSLFPEPLPIRTPVVYRSLETLFQFLERGRWVVESLREPRPSPDVERRYPRKWEHPRFILLVARPDAS